jgi:hypothetical protein
MWITGYTNNRLNEVRTLDKNEPYKVGVNGVFNVQNDLIEYEIDGILYKTFLRNPTQTGREGNFFNKYKKTYTTPSILNNKTETNTFFKVQKTVENFEYKPLIKEEEKLEQVFLPEIEDEIFIERTHTNVYEKHMRLMDIKNIGQLETYKNGFYNIKKG